MKVNNEQVEFNIFKTMKYLEFADDYLVVSIINQTIIKVQERSQFSNPLEHILNSKDTKEEDEELVELMALLDNQPSSNKGNKKLELVIIENLEPKINIVSTISPLELELELKPCNHLEV